jgi:hypothetical protein
VGIPVRLARDLHLGVILDPQPDQGPIGAAHALLTGKLSGSVRDRLAAGAEKILWEAPALPA